MEEAKDKLVHLTEDSQFIGLYDGEKMKEWENNSRLEYAKKQGLKEGQSKEKISIAKKMKEEGMSNEVISRLTELSLDEIAKL